MIHEEICTYEVCKLAKEKGFPQDDWSWCGDLYDDKGELCFATNSESCVAPTQSLLQRWLREEKGYYVYPFFDNESRRWTWVCRELTGDMWIQLLDFEERYFATYELALEDALKYALENLV
jgi:hypothetical protein